MNVLNVWKKCSQQNVMRGKKQHSVTESMAVEYKLRSFRATYKTKRPNPYQVEPLL
jgi:hypothetical protein